MGAPTFLDLAASIDRTLHRNINFPFKTVTAGAVAMTLNDFYFKIDASAGNVTLTLPSASFVNAGMGFWLMRVDSSANTVSVAGTGGQTLNGAASANITGQFAVLNIVSDGSNWLLFASPSAFALSPDVLWAFPGQISTDQDPSIFSYKARRAQSFVSFDVNARIAPSGGPILVDWAINGLIQAPFRVTVAMNTTFGETAALGSLLIGDEIRPVLSGVGSVTPGQTIIMRMRGF